ncbi:MAG: VanZ family protein [Candidatus Omnitrophica bacterium]|nr:VanZ family protein [Candidatus Omnitrophota bacterium]
MIVFLWAYFIFYSSSIPQDKVPSLFPFQDILYHLIVYLILAFLLKRAIIKTFRGIDIRRSFFITVLFCLIYAFSDELHQGFVGRDFSIIDISVDGLGIIMGTNLYLWQR